MPFIIQSVLYFCITVALIVSSIGWFNKDASWWLVPFAVATLGLTFLQALKISRDVFFNTTFDNTLTQTDCCCCSPRNCCSKPKSAKYLFISLRIIAGLMSGASIIFSLFYREDFLNKKTDVLKVVWSVTIVFWLLSCVPLFVCLLQCAANDLKDLKKNDDDYNGNDYNGKIDKNEIILRFRKSITMWLIHDIFLGVFWLYLVLMLHDITDDEDDSEWRTIFLSMLSWHIVVVVIREIYFKHQWSVDPIKKSDETKVDPCCSVKNAPRLWRLTRLSCFAAIYTMFILRMQNDSLVDMGGTWHMLIVFIIAIFTAFLSVTIDKTCLRTKPAENNTGQHNYNLDEGVKSKIFF